jgi:hypothetical protein
MCGPKLAILARREKDENFAAGHDCGARGGVDQRPGQQVESGGCPILPAGQIAKRESQGFPVRRLHLPLLLISQTSLREFAKWQTLSNFKSVLSLLLFFVFFISVFALFLLFVVVIVKFTKAWAMPI